MSKKISAQITFSPPNKDQIRWGLVGALEAINELISKEGESEEKINLKNRVQGHLDKLDKI